MGGENFYAFAPNAQVWVDPLGLNKCCENSKVKTEPNTAFFWSGRTDGIGGQHIAADIAKSKGGTTLEMLIEARKLSCLRGIKITKQALKHGKIFHQSMQHALLVL